MNLDEAQKQKVREWIAQGLQLSEIQNRLASEFKVRLTYMDVRFLVDDLKLTPKDIERSKPTTLGSSAPVAPPAPVEEPIPQGEAQPAAAGGGVSVKVDQLARPGAVASGKVTFSDGHVAEWYFDQTGRLGLVPQQAGYRPPPSDLQQFQTALDAELSKMGF